MSKVKIGLWILLFSSLGLVNILWLLRGQDPSKYLEAMATYMSAVGGIFIGFGVLISKKERNAIEEQMTSVNAFLTPKPYDDAALAVKKICATDLSAIQLMANDLLALSKSFEVAGNNMRDASKSLNEIHKSQMKMAHGAQTWLLIGVFISFISSLFLTLFPLVTK